MITYEQVTVDMRNNDPILKALTAEIIALDERYTIEMDRYSRREITSREMIRIGAQWTIERRAITKRQHARLREMAAESAPA